MMIPKSQKMSHGQDPNQQFLKSRIYFSKGPDSLAATANKHYVSSRTPEETFQHQHFHGEMPTTSTYNKDQIGLDAENIKASKDVGTWITVIGIIPGRFQEVREYFAQFGEINHFEEGPGNYGYIEFASSKSAKTPLDKSQTDPLIITKSYIVSVAPGRLKPHYISKINDNNEKINYSSFTKESKSREKVSFLEAIKNALIGE